MDDDDDDDDDDCDGDGDGLPCPHLARESRAIVRWGCWLIV
jgi:hypothetical protein